VELLKGALRICLLSFVGEKDRYNEDKAKK